MPDLGDLLSEREIEVLECVAEGASNKEIASRLSISQNTVKVHLRNISTKLGASSRTEAVTLGIQQGVVTVPGMVVAEPVVAETAVILPTPNSQFQPVAPSIPPEVVPPPRRFDWRYGVGVLLLLIVAVAVGLWLFNPTATETPFVETPIADTHWLLSKPMPSKRANFAIAAVGLNVYQIGGETADGVVGDMMVFRSGDHVWEAATSKPTAVSDSSADVLFGEIYLPGGRLADGTPTDLMEVYSPANDAWRPAAALPEPVFGGVAIAQGGFLYFFGGANESGERDAAYVYDPGSDSWRPLPPLPTPRSFATGGSMAGLIYVVGGFQGEQELDSCEAFNPIDETWLDCPPMLLPRGGAGSAVVLNKLYVLGGGVSANSETAFGEVYDPKSDTWQVVNLPLPDEMGDWAYLGVTHIESRIYALGGRQGEKLTDSNLVYAPLVYQTFLPSAKGGN
ncbi:MAG: LuxR C-terminal-related transcriptional regulator [Chloroflexota bacterium]